MTGRGLRAAVRRVLADPRAVKRRVADALGAAGGVQVVWPERGRAVLEPVRLRPPRGRELLVLAHATAVSAGTERAMFAGLPDTTVRFPFVPGYAFAGEVVMGGGAADGFAPGDRVAAALPHASLALVSDELLARIPDGVPAEHACFAQLGVVALHGVRRAEIRLGDRVAVLGPGLIGQLLIQLLAAHGVRSIVAVGASPRRLPLAAAHGAHATVDLADATAVDNVGADVTFDVTGNPTAVSAALRCTRPGGRIVLLGSNRGTTPQLDLARIRDAGLTLVGAHVTALDGPAQTAARATVLRFMADGRLRVDRLLTDEVTPVEAERLYRRLVQPGSEVLGAVFRWDRLADAQRCRLPWAARANRRPAVPAPAPPAVAASPRREVDGEARPLRVGLVGCGEIGLENACAVREAAGAMLAIVMDVDANAAEDLGRRFGVPATADLDALLGRADVDAVLLAVPHAAHAPLAIRAAQAGKHVMVEKPMATSVAEADAIIAAARAAGVQLSVIYCQRYLPYVAKARALIEQGALGTLLGLHLVHYLDKPAAYWTGGRTGRVSSTWRTSKAESGGGILVFNLVHYLDLIRYLTGREFVEVYGDCATVESPSETEDTISISVRLTGGVVGNVTAASCVRGSTREHQQLHLWGSDGHLVVGEPLRFYSLRQVEAFAPGTWHTLAEWPWGVERRLYVEEFARAVQRGEAPSIGAADGRAVQAVVEAVYAAQARRQPVRVGGEEA